MNVKKFIVEYVLLQALFAVSSTVALSYFYVLLVGQPTDFRFAQAFPWIASFLMLFVGMGIRFYNRIAEAGLIGGIEILKKIK